MITGFENPFQQFMISQLAVYKLDVDNQAVERKTDRKNTDISKGRGSQSAEKQSIASGSKQQVSVKQLQKMDTKGDFIFEN
jgi:hypothetical protein